MKRRIRIACFVLAMLTLLTTLALPTFAAPIEEIEAAPADVVLLLDCSGSLYDNDPKQLCLEACKSFVDTLPASKEVRVAVIGFGYRQGGEHYTFATEYMVEYDLEKYLIHVVVPLSDLSDSEDKEEYKNTVVATLDKTRQIEDTWTPIAPAIASAVDYLESKGTTAGNGCIVLISDGVESYCAQRFYHPTASKRAGELGYPIYCVELNYNNPDKNEVAAAQKLMDEICSNSGDRDVGRISCETPTDVHVALQKIFCDFFELPWKDPVPVSKLPAEYSFTIPELTSEATINIFGEGLEYVELINVAEGTTQKINKDVESERLIAVVEDGSYYSLKMIVPTAGEWKIKMHGDENGEAQVALLVNNTAMQEMGLTMVANPSSSAAELIKSDTIEVNAFFEYRNIEVHNSAFYAQNPASVMVYSANGTTQEYPMEADSNGYKLKLPLLDVPSGDSIIQVVLEHNMFRNGKKVSNTLTFRMKNLALELAQDKSGPYKAYVNSTIDNIDMTKFFNNPDNDYVDYTVTCTSNREATFDFTVTNDSMDIQAGLVPGTYTVEVGATDPDMTTPLIHTMTLEIEDRKPGVEKIRQQKVWIDRYNWQKSDKLELDLNLDEYFSDPDGVQMTYTTSQNNENIEIAQDGSVLNISPVAKGKTEVTVTGTDGVSDISATFTVNVVSGKAVYWQQNWIWYVLAAALLIFIVIVIIIIVKNKLVKGEWNISIDENGTTYELENTMNIANFTRVGKKGKFLLKDLLSELALFMDDGSSLSLVLPDYFVNNGADKIELVGVVRKQGCTVTNIPKDSNVHVYSNGVETRVKAKVFGGSLNFNIEKSDGSGDRLTVTMFLRSGR